MCVIEGMEDKDISVLRRKMEEVNHVKEMWENQAPLVKSCCEMLAKLYFFVSFANKSLLFRTKVACKLVLGWRVAKDLSEKIRAPWPGYRLKQKG